MAEPTNTEKQPKSIVNELSKPKFALLITSVFLGLFLVILDKLIISTAIPAITNEFNSANDLGWYGTAYLLTGCTFQLVFGKLYTLFPIRVIFLTSIVLFEIGSTVCGAAPNSIAFILGRAIAGLGGGGIQSGVFVVIVYNIPLAKRPAYQGLFGAVLGISSVLGPLVGGAFTTNVSWRWCFYINLPIGALVMVACFFLLQEPDRPAIKIPLKQKLPQLNFLGLLALFPGVICLCLALQWGGSTYAWSEGRIIALLVISSVLLVTFVFIQGWKPEQATVPPRIFLQRSVLAGFWVSACLGACLNVFVYFIPTWFQAIQSVNAVQSGVHLLALVLPLVVATMITGKMTSVIGYYTPFLLFGLTCLAIGSGLLNTLTPDTTKAQWIGYLVIWGFGMGCSTQAPNVAAQTVLSKSDAAIGGSLMLFANQLSGSIFLSVGQNLLNTQLASKLSAIPGLGLGGDAAVTKLILTSGLTALLERLPAEFRDKAVWAYNGALRDCFRLGLVLACVAMLGALAMEWRSVKEQKEVIDAEKGSSDKNLREEVDKKMMLEERKTQDNAEVESRPSEEDEKDSSKMSV